MSLLEQSILTEEPLDINEETEFSNDRVTAPMVAALVASEGIFDRKKFMGNPIGKWLRHGHYAVIVQKLVEDFWDDKHYLYVNCPIKYMSSSVQGQNLVYFVRVSVGAILCNKVEELLANAAYKTCVAALIEWTKEGIAMADDQHTLIRATLSGVTIYDKRGFHFYMTHRCVDRLHEISVDSRM